MKEQRRRQFSLTLRPLRNRKYSKDLLKTAAIWNTLIAMKKIVLKLTFLILTGCSNLLYYPTDILYMNPERLPASFEETEIALSDGTKIQGWYFKSKKPPKAVVLLLHGNGQNRSSHYISLYWLIENGYDLAVFDYPGYGISDGQPTPENTVETGRVAIQYLHDRNPKLPLVVYGKSLGGAVAMRSVLEMRGKVKPHLLVVDSSFLSYRRAARRIMSKSVWTWALQPFSYVLIDDKWAVSDRVSELEGIPLIVIHSREDQIIPFELGQEVFEKAATPKEFWVKETGGHSETYVGDEGFKLRGRLLKTLHRLTSSASTEILLSDRYK